jgi:hypothetical protein
MSDSFLDRLGDQLAAAERTLGAVAVPRAARRGRVTRRAAVVVLCGLAIAVPALAAIKPWRPLLGRPELADVPGGTATSPVPRTATDLLGVLRRPQEERDRGPASQRLLRLLGQQFAGVRTDSVRLTSDAAGHHALVVSAEHVAGIGDAVCLVFAGGVNCGMPDEVQSGDFYMTAGESVRGLVPDGVARVMLIFDGGQTASADVRDNVFWFGGASTTAKPGPAAPPAAGASPAPMVLTAKFTLRWLDAAGKVIGPPMAK